MRNSVEAQQTIVPNTLGGKLPRIDGAYKVSGTAIYTSDISFPNMLYAVPVCATIVSGKINTIDDQKARAMPGVKAIFASGDIGPFYTSAPPTKLMGRIEERRPPLEDDVISYYGQYVALVVAQTFEQATAAADTVVVTYEKSTFDVSPNLSASGPLKVQSPRGDPETTFTSAPVKVDQVYVTPAETHNPIELHARVAVWDGDSVTLYETSQGIVNHRLVLAQVLGLPVEKVRVVSHFLGSGFGSKLFPWSHSALAADAAKRLNAPIKLVVTRQTMFQSVGHRALTQQHLRVGATEDGKLVSLQQDFLSHGSMLDDYLEDCGRATPFMHSVPNLSVRSGLARKNVGTPTTMRGPGAVPGLYAVESAMDELAIKLNMDPMRFRLLNEPTIDESRNVPFSSRHVRECIETGAKRFGWESRTPHVGSMKRDG